MKQIEIGFRAPRGEKRIKYAFDDQQPVQATMLGELSRGVPYESEISELMINTLLPGDAFVDVGAHVGYFSVLAASLVGDCGTVFSFEPELVNHTALLRNIKLNGADKSVCAFRAAVTDRCGVSELYFNLDNDGGHALWPVEQHMFNPKTKANPRTVNIDTVTLDSILAKVPAIRMMKLDVEGSEVSVLKGATEALSRTQNVICEINRIALQAMGTSEDELRRLMHEHGFSCYLPIRNSELIVMGLDSKIELDEGLVFNLLFRRDIGERK